MQLFSPEEIVFSQIIDSTVNQFPNLAEKLTCNWNVDELVPKIFFDKAYCEKRVNVALDRAQRPYHRLSVPYQWPLCKPRRRYERQPSIWPHQLEPAHYMRPQVHSSWHDDVIKWKHFPRYWPFVRGIRRSPVNSPHKGQWRRALMFSLICAWMECWVNTREAGN